MPLRYISNPFAQAMTDDVRFHKSIDGAILDTYLAAGWYRGGCLIFTTHSLEPFHDGQHFRVFWLRYLVPAVKLGKKCQRILTLNKQFVTSYRQFSHSPQLDELHRAYRDSIGFEAANSLQDLLKDHEHQVYNTYVAEVHHEGKLIAAGIFDVGGKAIAGIVNVIHPDYKKYSLGKYLMLLKYQYCAQHGIPLYYPGYFAPGYPVFDYKLFLDKDATEVLLPELNRWVPYRTFCNLTGLAE